MNNVKSEYRVSLIRFGALTTLNFDELVDQAVRLENAELKQSNAAVKALTSGSGVPDETTTALQQKQAEIQNLQFQV